ncbi:hypothetical protein IDH44_16345 [Paenibacillus sp. IB182496]|uniref:Uncharacterized protein n=1 Tax=Paenibacillus sabuli TaxID=2772509 RepID=A0A927GSN9_9BACL|nr:hypothetical protein [Paenibacillus sabuli]MBD2846768.1 hypothetical protein [Paenibacillus sabuli]
MNVTILKAGMKHTPEDGYVGHVHVQVEGHRDEYEVTLHSTRGKSWSYGLHFLHASGKEEEIFAFEEQLEEDDELFDSLVEAARAALRE